MDETARPNTIASLRERVTAGDVGVRGPLAATFLLAFLAGVTGLILLVGLARLGATATRATTLVWVNAWNALLYLPAFAALALYVHGEDSRLRDLFAFDRDRLARDVGRGVLLAVPLLVADAAIEYPLVAVASGIWGDPFAVAPALPTLPLLGLLLVASALAGVAEEAVYRGYALPRIAARTAPAVGVAVTALGFALQHAVLLLYVSPPYAVVRGVAAAAVGVLLGWLYLREGERLVPLVAAHAAWTLVSVLAFGALF
ncbi:CPBP family intramembrane glutamic endopeptidase [Halocalculus aciditolerans]|uniref:CAAX prenyl protease 2/Lysostaphin resistance protein A-like domain-containing protein n=1 Tax=Halocalculus aciditolerans TaxID=1383812 RepID=A0A830FAI8_9EURY|nr:CPBP family intramembrane glutamic endopeptidase [Halocalculus aciditolerans]GGL70515.1 hypothetical protein GCM10009039_30720 [Halocalculus aciditolerans]